MADLIIAQKEDIVAVADAIRSQTGNTSELTLNEMINDINYNINSGSSGVSSWNDLTDKPFYIEEVWNELISETTLSFNLNDGVSVCMTPATTEMLEMYNSEWGKALVLWDGVEYECQPKMFNGMIKAVGNVEAMEGTGDSGEPFAMLIDSDGLIMGTPIAMVVSITDSINGTASSTHTVGVSLLTESIHPLDPKFIDDVSWNKISDKPFGEFPSGTVIADEDVAFISELNPLGVDLENFVAGVQYDITINDDTYFATAYKDTDSGYVQISVVQDGGTIFAFVSPHSVFWSDTLTVGETYHIKIAFAEDYVKTIDAKFLPSTSPEVTTPNLPIVTADDNGKLLQVVDGVWSAVTITNGNEVAY